MRLCNNKLALWPWTYMPGLCTCSQTISVLRALAGRRSRLSWQPSRSSQSISSQLVRVCLGVQKFQGGAQIPGVGGGGARWGPQNILLGVQHTLGFIAWGASKWESQIPCDTSHTALPKANSMSTCSNWIYS